MLYGSDDRDAQDQLSLASAPGDTELRTELVRARRALAQYERVLGPNPEAAEDVKLLASRLEALETERASLALQLGEAEAVRHVPDKADSSLQTRSLPKWRVLRKCGKDWKSNCIAEYST
jgi:hypothetical protein